MDASVAETMQWVWHPFLVDSVDQRRMESTVQFSGDGVSALSTLQCSDADGWVTSTLLLKDQDQSTVMIGWVDKNLCVCYSEFW